ncbi:MAG: CotH kinase family protein [Bacteroidales bacterium]|nr:CotH kinase family protein [Bacteroidales bacterium]
MRINGAFRGTVVLLTLLSISLVSDAQVSHPEPGFVFDDAEVPRIDITISQSNLQELYADPESNMEYYAVFSFTRGDSTEGPLDIGLRIRGDSIRLNEKKSFRVSFNSIDAGFDFHGIEKMNLNAEANDPSLVRSKLGHELYRYLGVAASRSNHVLLYINNQYYGVYLNTEHVDEKFVKSRFDTNDGNLFICQKSADLAYLGPNQDYYKLEVGGEQVYALRTNEKWDDYEDLEQLIDILNHNSGDPLKNELERVMNVQQYLKIMALDVMTGTWDGYIGNSNNYYLYRDQATGRFEYIPYNLENSAGIDFLGVDWSARSIYNWNRNVSPLYTGIQLIEEYKEQYTSYIKTLAAYMGSTALTDEMTRWRQQISDHVANDTCFSKDWGFTFTDFEAAMVSGWGTHVNYGVAEFATLRTASALAEAVDADAFPLISFERVVPREGSIEVDWTAEDDDPGYATTLHYRIDGGSWESSVMGTPAETDPVSGVHTYRDTIRSFGAESEVDLYLTVTDQGGQLTRFPDTFLTVTYPLLSGPLFINEFVASNQGITVDEFGEYDDWAEIYNASGEQVWLADYFLSDNMGNPGKYRFPEIYIEPDGFYLVWLDDTPDQGPNHAAFKISKDGEMLRLSERPSKGFALVDMITFGVQQSDISWGRELDGGPDWISFVAPTPQYSNLLTGVNDMPAPDASLTIYPNPVSAGFFYFSKQVSGAIYNMMGQKMMELKETEFARIPSLNQGVYIFRSEQGETVQFIVTR